MRALRSGGRGRVLSVLFGAVLLHFSAIWAGAFPSWIGACCGYSRHDGNNGGTFTILMNQDYYGLHADIVIQVNGGAWTTNAMTYVGNTSGNSVWQYKPTTPFKGGSTIRYAFHGWDDWGGSIWDNNGGNDYSFTRGPDWVGAVRSNVVQNVGNTQRVLFFLNSAVTNDGGLCEVVPYAPDVVRVRYHFTPGTNDLWLKPDIAIAKTLTNWASVSLSITNQGGATIIETSQLKIECKHSPYFHVNFYDKSGYLLQAGVRMEYNEFYYPEQDNTYYSLSDSVADMPEGFKLKGVFVMPDEEQYFGLGEIPTGLNRRGTRVQLWNSDVFYWQEFRNPMYMSMPILYGVQPAEGTNHPAFAYGLFFNNPARPVFDLRVTVHDEYYIEAGDGQFDYFFFSGGTNHSMRNVLGRYSELTGLPAHFPKWAYGHHLARWSYPNQAAVEAVVGDAVSYGMPLDAVYLDLDYMDVTPDDYYEDNSLRPLTFSTNFPNVAGMISTVGSNGVRLVPIMEAWYTERTGDAIYQEAHANNHFVHDIDGDPRWYYDHFFGDLWWFDYTSGPFRNWWTSKLTNFLASYPFPGIWNDLNEPADPLYRFAQNDVYWMSDTTNASYSAYDSRRWHVNVKNTYNVYETRHTYETLANFFTNQRPFVLSRAGWPGVQRHAMGWSGDNNSTWTHNRINISLGLSVMMSGQVNFGHDIGGFIVDDGTPNDRPRNELIVRWYEWSALTPFFRNHSMKWDGYREPWVYDTTYRDKMIESIKFRYKLMPYLYTLAYESTQSGEPMNMPVVMQFQSDTNTYNQSYDFMVGDNLLAAPVYTEGATNRWVYLPSGTTWYQLHSGSYWFDWHNPDKYTGGQWVNIAAPLGIMPLFAKAGAIVPVGPSMQYTGEYKPDYLDLHMWPASSNSWTLFEDDGITPNGPTARQRFVSQDASTQWTVTLQARTGSYDPERDHYIVVLHDIASVTNVVLNTTNSLAAYGSIMNVRTNPTPGYYYYSDVDELFVKVANTGEVDTIVVQK